MTKYNKTYNTIFPYTFIFFILSGYIISPTPTWAITFYALLAPTTIFLTTKNRNLPIEAFKDRAFLTSFIMIIWFLLTISWGINQPDFNIKKYIWRSTVNLLFIFTAIYFFSHKNNKWKENLFRYFPYAVAINVFLSLIMYYIIKDAPLNTRLIGWAEARHPILGSLVILTGFCISYYQSKTSKNIKQKITYGAICFLCVLFVLLTQSRGPLLTLMVISGIFALLSGKAARWTVLATITFLVLIFIFNKDLQSFAVHSLTRNPWRFEIWMDAWEYIKNAPIIGNGLASLNNFSSINQKSPHSIYVSAAFYGGFIGFGILMALFGQLALIALKTEDANKRMLHLGLLCVPTIGGLTDLAQVSKSPGELWYILWIPATIIIGHAIQTRREKHAPSRPQQTIR